MCLSVFSSIIPARLKVLFFPYKQNLHEPKLIKVSVFFVIKEEKYCFTSISRKSCWKMFSSKLVLFSENSSILQKRVFLSWKMCFLKMKTLLKKIRFATTFKESHFFSYQIIIKKSVWGFCFPIKSRHFLAENSWRWKKLQQLNHSLNCSELNLFPSGPNTVTWISRAVSDLLP